MLLIYIEALRTTQDRADQLNSERASLKKRLVELEAKSKDHSHAQARFNQSLDALKQERDKAQREMAKQNEKINSLRKQLDTAELRRTADNNTTEDRSLLTADYTSPSHTHTKYTAGSPNGKRGKKHNSVSPMVESQAGAAVTQDRLQAQDAADLVHSRLQAELVEIQAENVELLRMLKGAQEAATEARRAVRDVSLSAMSPRAGGETARVGLAEAGAAGAQGGGVAVRGGQDKVGGDDQTSLSSQLGKLSELRALEADKGRLEKVVSQLQEQIHQHTTMEDQMQKELEEEVRVAEELRTALASLEAKQREQILQHEQIRRKETEAWKHKLDQTEVENGRRFKDLQHRCGLAAAKVKKEKLAFEQRCEKVEDTLKTQRADMQQLKTTLQSTETKLGKALSKVNAEKRTVKALKAATRHHQEEITELRKQAEDAVVSRGGLEGELAALGDENRRMKKAMETLQRQKGRLELERQREREGKELEAGVTAAIAEELKEAREILNKTKSENVELADELLRAKQTNKQAAHAYEREAKLLTRMLEQERTRADKEAEHSTVLRKKLEQTKASLERVADESAQKESKFQNELKQVNTQLALLRGQTVSLSREVEEGQREKEQKITELMALQRRLERMAEETEKAKEEWVAERDAREEQADRLRQKGEENLEKAKAAAERERRWRLEEEKRRRQQEERRSMKQAAQWDKERRKLQKQVFFNVLFVCFFFSLMFFSCHSRPLFSLWYGTRDVVSCICHCFS